MLNHVLGNPLIQPLMTLRNSALGATPVDCMGLRFSNPVGLSAGLDKNADYLNGLGALGFGFIEVGTVTPRAQAGNPQPRMFRLIGHQAIINRLGFNNKGVDYLVERVKKRRYNGILGINIGKNADTPLSDANEDYLICLRKVYPHADYITVNISSPNTPGLRELQHGDMLRELFDALKREQYLLATIHGKYKPIAIKIAPDMDDGQLDAFANQALAARIDAVIATNTTFSRDGVESSEHAKEVGGLSGAPLRSRATHTVAHLGIRFADQIPIIGVGGIVDTASGLDKIHAGAQLIQIYTGLIYAGPSLVKQLINATGQR